MKAYYSTLVVLLLTAGCASREVRMRQEFARMDAQATVADAGSQGQYQIGAGDSLKIEFYYNEELNRTVLVRPDGYISLPLVQDIRVGGMTPLQVRDALSKSYAGVIKKAVLTVSLENPGSFKVYVGGEVANPGVFALSDGVTLWRAITMAGGAKSTARLCSVVVIRDRGEATPQYLLLDMTAGVSRLDGRQELALQPKDMVYIPKSKIATMNQFVDQYINQLIPFQKSLNVSYLFGERVY